MPGPQPRSLLRDTHPDVFLEAVRVVDSGVALTELSTQSNRGVIWRGDSCGHEWEAKPAARSRGGGCPECARGKRARSRAQAPPGRSLLRPSPFGPGGGRSEPHATRHGSRRCPCELAAALCLEVLDLFPRVGGDGCEPGSQRRLHRMCQQGQGGAPETAHRPHRHGCRARDVPTNGAGSEPHPHLTWARRSQARIDRPVPVAMLGSARTSGRRRSSTVSSSRAAAHHVQSGEPPSIARPRPRPRLRRAGLTCADGVGDLLARGSPRGLGRARPGAKIGAPSRSS